MGLVVDNFAGGGGASTGIEMALGRAVDVAINHDEAAVAVHTANHPSTKHYCQSIFSVDPLDATGGAPTMLAWFSPDCKHHSKAKGGKPRDKNIRDMAWVVPHWIERLQRSTPNGQGAPQVIMLENVEEFRQWGPLDPATGMPIKERQGEEFNLWVRRIKRLGYKVQHRELRACDYGAPTSRKRLFLIARRDGMPITWPKPTHGHPESREVKRCKLLPWRTAAECIDWSIPCPSIFDRKRPLKDATCRRIAAGVMRYVVNSAKPFIISVAHGDSGGRRTYPIDEPLGTVSAGGNAHAAVSPGIVPITHTKNAATAHSIEEPVRTITTAKGGELAITAANLIKLRRHSEGEDVEAPLGAITAGGLHHGVANAVLVPHVMTNRNAAKPYTAASEPTHTITAGGAHQNMVAATLVQTGYGEREGQVPRALDVHKPLGTVVAGGAKHAAVAAFLAQHNTGVIGRAADKPLSTIVHRGTQQQIVQTTLVEADALPADMMDRAVQVAAFLVKYYGNEEDGHGLGKPMGTVTTRDRFAVVTVTIDAVTFVLADIGMRMLTPRELANAQGFPRDYVLDPECWYATEKGNRKFGRLPITHQIAKIGNSVCPDVAAALVRANFPAAVSASGGPERGDQAAKVAA